MSPIAFPQPPGYVDRLLLALARTRRSGWARCIRRRAWMLALLTAGCPECYTADPPEPPSSAATGAMIVPATLSVQSGDAFTIRARLFDATKGIIAPLPGELTWTPAGGLTHVDMGGDSIVLKANPVTARTSIPVTLKVASLSGVVTANVIVLPANWGAVDNVVADPSPNPTVAFLHGQGLANCLQDSVIAFVGVGLAGSFVGDCPAPVTSRVAALFADSEIGVQPVTWSPGPPPDVVSFSAVSTLPAEFRAFAQPLPQPAPRFKVDYVVWTAAVGATQLLVESEIAGTADKYHLGRSGLELRGAFKPIEVNESFFVDRRKLPTECADEVARLKGNGFPSGFGRDSLNVLYVTSVDYIREPLADHPDQTVPITIPGYACPPTPTHGSILVITWGMRSTTTLPHEMGHALGLLEPAWGHTTGAPGFGYTNMMWTGMSDAGPGARAHLTLGQAFRVNMASQSWLFQSKPALRPGSGLDCDNPTATWPCPKLARDIVAPPPS